MKSERYFQNPEMRREALDSYARFSSKKAQVLLDADLAIPGSSEPVYQSYARQIRQEYAWVPEAEYRQGRRRVLENFLSPEQTQDFPFLEPA